MQPGPRAGLVRPRGPAEITGNLPPARLACRGGKRPKSGEGAQPPRRSSSAGPWKGNLRGAAESVAQNPGPSGPAVPSRQRVAHSLGSHNSMAKRETSSA